MALRESNCLVCNHSGTSEIDCIIINKAVILATEETTVTQVSQRPIKCQSRSWSQRYSQNPCQVQPTENMCCL